MIERERKFLVYPALLPKLTDGNRYRVGYFTRGPCAIRVHLNDTTSKAKFTFKGPGLEERLEVEREISMVEALQLLELAPYIVVKTRYRLNGWEIDLFETPNGLYLAEWEEAEGKRKVPMPLPTWIASEVTSAPGFANSMLAVERRPESR